MLLKEPDMRQSLARMMMYLLAIMSLMPLAARAQSAGPISECPPPGYRLDVRPDPRGPPTQIDFGLRVIDVSDINDVNQTITLDMIVRMRWTDPRLLAWAGCKLSIGDIWFPQLALKNSGRMFARWPETVSVEKGGEITYLQRVSGTFASYHKLADFPFDSQVISLWVYPLEWSSSKVNFRIDETFTGLGRLLNISDWEITGVVANLLEQKIDGFEQVRSGYQLQISAERYLSYYIWKVMIPIALIVVMSWSVFWIYPTEFGTQIGLSATSVLTMVAFIFATTNLLPKLGYFTMLDKYIAGATVMVFVALMQSLITGFLAAKDRETLANRIDIVSRFLFPLTFVVLCWIFFRGLA